MRDESTWSVTICAVCAVPGSCGMFSRHVSEEAIVPLSGRETKIVDLILVFYESFMH